PSAWPLIAVPSMNWLFVQTDATVVISLMTTGDGGELPKTDNIAIAGLSPAPLLTKASPPLATTYKITFAAGVSVLVSSNGPSPFGLAWASCFGSPALAAQSVTDEFAIPPPPACTWPSIRIAALAGLHAKPSAPSVTSMATICAVLMKSVRTRNMFASLKGGLCPECRAARRIFPEYSPPGQNNDSFRG